MSTEKIMNNISVYTDRINTKKEVENAIAHLCSQIQEMPLYEKAELAIQLNDLIDLAEGLKKYLTPTLTEFTKNNGKITVGNRCIKYGHRTTQNYSENTEWCVLKTQREALEKTLKGVVSSSLSEFIIIPKD